MYARVPERRLFLAARLLLLEVVDPARDAPADGDPARLVEVHVGDLGPAVLVDLEVHHAEHQVRGRRGGLCALLLAATDRLGNL